MGVLPLAMVVVLKSDCIGCPIAAWKSNIMTLSI